MVWILIAEMIGLAMMFPKHSLAVLPPDFIFNVGIQISQFLSLAVIFLTAGFGIGYRFLAEKWKALKYRWIWLILVVILVLGGGSLIIYFYNANQQKATYNNWLIQSQQQTAQITPTLAEPTVSEKLAIQKNNEEFLVRKSSDV